MRRFLILLLPVFLFACSGDDEDKVNLKMTLEYVEDGQTLPRANARVCLYDAKDYTTDWIFGYTIEGSSVENGDGKIISPKYIFKADEKGVINVEIEDNVSYVYTFQSVVNSIHTTGYDFFEAKGKPVEIKFAL